MKKNKKTLVSLALVFLGSVIIWTLGIYIVNLIPDQQMGRLAFGITLTTLSVAMLYFASRFFDKKPFTFIYGTNNLRAFLTGATYFVAPAVAAAVLMSLFGMISIAPQVSATEILIGLVAVMVLVFLSEALPEELIFRGYLLKKLSYFSKTWVAFILQAVLFLIFAFLIGAVSDPLDASFLVSFAAVLGILRAATGSVWAAIGFHLACMTFQQGFSGAWPFFSVSEPSTLQMIAFGIIPFSFAIALLASKVRWTKQLN